MSNFDGPTLSVDRGDTLQFDFVVNDNGTPIDTTTWQELWFTVKRSPEDTDAVAILMLTRTGGGITPTGPTGAHRGEILPAHTDGLPSYTQDFVWDLQGKDAAGRVYTLRKGPFVVNPDVTRTTSVGP